jgi:hypothetical protein
MTTLLMAIVPMFRKPAASTLAFLFVAFGIYGLLYAVTFLFRYGGWVSFTLAIGSGGALLIPVGAMLAAINADWVGFATVVFTMVLALACRSLATWISARAPAR